MQTQEYDKSKNYQAWCFTLFTGDNEELVDLQGAFDNSSVRYAVWQIERTPTTGRLHIQGYINLKSPRRYTYILGLSNGKLKGAHVEPARGDCSSNINYCTKEESRMAGPWEFGERPKDRQKNLKPGARRDLSEFTNAVMEVINFKPMEYSNFFINSDGAPIPLGEYCFNHDVFMNPNV